MRANPKSPTVKLMTPGGNSVVSATALPPPGIETGAVDIERGAAAPQRRRARWCPRLITRNVNVILAVTLVVGVALGLVFHFS